MRLVSVCVGLLLCAGLLAARDPIEQERAQKTAALLAAQARKLTDLPVKSDVETARAFGLKKGDLAALVIPDKGLTADRLDKASKDVLPVGQLWLRGLTPVVSGSAAAAEKLRMVKVEARGEEHTLSLLLLGVRRGAKDKLELVVY